MGITMRHFVYIKYIRSVCVCVCVCGARFLLYNFDPEYMSKKERKKVRMHVRETESDF